MPSVHTTEIDDVPVFWQEAPGPLQAGLLFACGTRDESFMTIGVTHLVEHLVMSTLPRAHYDRDASVDLTTTSFSVTGRPEQVVEFLAGVCTGISRLPVERLSQEVGVLDAEGGLAAHPTAAALLTRRYGIRDVGLEAWSGPGLANIRPDAVLAHLRRFFVNGNAVLWLSGPPPTDLRLALPIGPRVRRKEPAPMNQDGPRWSQEFVPSPGVLLRGERNLAMNIGMAILAARVEDEARHQHGLSYEVFSDLFHIGPTTREYVIGADARSGQDSAVAQILWQQIRQLAVDGPTEDELSHEKAGFAEAYADPRWPAEEAAGQAVSHLFELDQGTPEARLARVNQLTREDVRQVLARASATALMAVPPDISVNLEGVTEGGCPRRAGDPRGQRFVMKTLVRILARQWRAPTFYLSGNGLTRRDPDGDLHDTTFADIIGVEVDSDDRMVFSANGCVHHIVRNAYRDGDYLVNAIDSGVMPQVRYAPDGRPLPNPTVEVAAARRKKSIARIFNAMGAVVSGLAALVLIADWRYHGGSVWWVVATGVVCVWCAWDAIPKRRRRHDRP
jgi:hypothetical protein